MTAPNAKGRVPRVFKEHAQTDSSLAEPQKAGGAGTMFECGLCDLFEQDEDLLERESLGRIRLWPL